MTTGSSSRERRPDGAALVIAAILIGLAIIIFWQTSQMRLPPLQQRVGPTVFPYVIASALVLLGIGTIVSALRNGFPARSQDDYKPIFWIVGGLVGQILLLSTAGFSIGTGVLFACTARAFGRRPVWKSFLIGTVFSFVVWFIFAKGLQLSLPAGVLERLLTTGSL